MDSVDEPATFGLMAWNIYHGDCRDVMPTLHPESVDSIVSDPPYGLSFMGKGWDHGVPGVEFWVEALRVAKPGAHLLAFGGTRTYHRLACAIEDAGWEIRDCVMWVYGSGFPKSHDVSKAIDKAAGAEREVVGVTHRTRGICGEMAAAVRCSVCGKTRNGTSCKCDPDNGPATDAARQWQGWGTALKPAWEPIIVARKPLCGTVAENVLKHGTGGINVDGCRVGTETIQTNRYTPGRDMTSFHGSQAGNEYASSTHSGRWPANVIHDGSDEVVGLFPVTASGAIHGEYTGFGTNGIYGDGGKARRDRNASSGSAARFFYCAKASKADRDEGCEGLAEKTTCYMATANGTGVPSVPIDDNGNERDRFSASKRNHHPTVKPTALMRYLCRLVTPPGGVVLDPFTGSGSTGKAAILEGFRFIGIEREAEYVEIAKARIGAAEAGAGPLFSKCATH